MSRVRVGRSSLVAALAISLLLPGLAGASNRRISISNYQWSDPNIHINKGEHVTWYWVGPDTMHSVTGTSGNDKGVDSDPNTNEPQHQIGDNFKVDFSKPGVYTFQCKLHSSVRGTITVGPAQGNPNSEPDPVPKSQVDLKPPNLGTPSLHAYSFGRKGTALNYSLNEKARLSADFYEQRPGKKPKYVGYSNWQPGHVGYNHLRFGKKRKHFKAKPGKYVARLSGTDTSANTTREIPIKFKIFPRKK